MTPQKQTILSDPSAGIHGNCFSACLASLLDLPIETVPHFSVMGLEWVVEFIGFLNKNGYNYYGCSDFKYLPTENGVDGFVIVGGTSPRGTIRGHSVIYKDGQPFFDPHPSNDFLLEPTEIYSINRCA